MVLNGSKKDFADLKKPTRSIMMPPLLQLKKWKQPSRRRELTGERRDSLKSRMGSPVELAEVIFPTAAVQPSYGV